MIVLSKTYHDELVARRVAEDLAAQGVPERDILIVTGRRVRDVRGEAVGEFAGPIPPDAPVGTFGDRRVLRRQGAGAFAGDADRQRQGSFADAEREVLISHDDAGEHQHVAGHRSLRRVLRRRAIAPPAQEEILDEVDRGAAVVLIELATLGPGGVRARLDDAAHVA